MDVGRCFAEVRKKREGNFRVSERRKGDEVTWYATKVTSELFFQVKQFYKERNGEIH